MSYFIAGINMEILSVKMNNIHNKMDCIVGRNKIHIITASVCVVCSCKGIMSKQMVEFQRIIDGECASTSHLAENDIAGTIRNNAKEGGLVAIEGHTCRIYSTGEVPAVSISAPTEVEMEMAIYFVAITDKRVASCVTASTVHHRAVGGDIGAEHVLPYRIHEKGFLGIVEVGVETEKVYQSCTGIDIIAAALIGAIRHIGCHTAVAHEGGNGLLLQ